MGPDTRHLVGGYVDRLRRDLLQLRFLIWHSWWLLLARGTELELSPLRLARLRLWSNYKTDDKHRVLRRLNRRHLAARRPCQRLLISSCRSSWSGCSGQ